MNITVSTIFFAGPHSLGDFAEGTECVANFASNDFK